MISTPHPSGDASSSEEYLVSSRFFVHSYVIQRSTGSMMIPQCTRNAIIRLVALPINQSLRYMPFQRLYVRTPDQKCPKAVVCHGSVVFT